MSRRAAWVAAAMAAACAAAGAAAPAYAQSSPEITLRADADQIEVGDTVTVTLSAMSDSSGPQPGDPHLRAPAGWSSSGPVVSTQTRMSIVNGRISQKSGFQASWQLTPASPGTVEIGPVTFVSGGKRVNAGTVRVTVRPSSGRPRLRGRQPRGNNPFGGLFGFDPFADDDDSNRRPAEPPPPDPQLSLEAPIEPSAFLRAVVDKPKAMVGEQVTLTVYLYTQPRAFQVVDPHEPPAPDFYQRVIANGENEAHAVNVGGARWAAQMIRKVALFPLKAGDLEVGPMTLTLLGPGFRGGGMRGGLVRGSAPLKVHVEEPPLASRPAGYVVGDVGSYNLSVSVEPRKVEAGGSIAVSAVLRGVGNVPQSLRLPEKKGVNWLEPETHESIDASSGVVSGSRGFTYVVKLTEPGKVDLGDIGVSFWNPKLYQYQTARAALGEVEVTGTAPPPAPSAGQPGGARDPFAAVGPARVTPGPFAQPGAPWTDSPWYWAAVAGGPLGVLALGAGARALSSLAERRRQKAGAASTLVQKALSDAEAADAAKDGKAAAAAVERALVLAVDDAAGVKLRALLRDEVAPALAGAGVPEPLAGEVADILSACDAWRFLPGGSPEGPSPVERARAATKALASLRRPS